ncbi:MAG: HAMP domain-containing sensor histidine kinase [Hyphomicrobiaceae bacterium]
MKPGSLRLRLAAGGAAAILAALVLAGLGLSVLFERHVMRSLADDLEVDLRQMIAALELDATGLPKLTREPADPRFAEPLYGLYWQLGTPAGAVVRSRSLWDATIPLPHDALSPGEVHHHRVVGPGASTLLAVERTVLLKFNETRLPIRLVVAADLAKIVAARRSFTDDLIPSLALLGLVLAVATWVQVSLGLRPLARVREGIAAIREGQATAIEGATPSEVTPLVQEINALVKAQETDLGRARGRAADLAHGLKTPLSALSADVRALRARGDADIAGRIEEVCETMRRHIERELARARVRGKRGFGGPPPTLLGPLVESLVSIQRRSGPGERLSFEIDLAADFKIAMDRTDAAEVLGNLLDNARRHARAKVRISASDDGRVSIEDDGSGVPEDMREWVRARGARLDQRPDGAGLGLAIVQDVLAAYDRGLSLEISSLGGLKVTF